MSGTWKINLIASGLVVCLIPAFWVLFFGKSSEETQENNDGPLPTFSGQEQSTRRQK